jgi:hypothetical protein
MDSRAESYELMATLRHITCPKLTSEWTTAAAGGGWRM